MKLHIKNFRSIKQLDLELAPITVLYGHNGTGKSSVLYAPLTLKNIVVNPNQHIPEFFNYGFTSLGTFEEVVFDHNPNSVLELGISLEAVYGNPASEGYVAEVKYNVACQRDATGTFQFRMTIEDYQTEDPAGRIPAKRTLHESTLPVSFPNEMRDYKLLGVEQSDRIIRWNGISTEDITRSPYDDDVRVPSDLEYTSGLTIEMLNLPASELRGVSFVPLGRGFFQPWYSLGNQGYGEYTPPIEREVTDLLATNRHLEYAVNQHMEMILNRNFHIRADIGSSSNQFSLDSIDRKTGLGASLVNEGFGVNQLVYMLAKVLHPDAGIVCIEEPEIHLHPSAIRRLARALADIVGENGDKRLIISTHSKQFIMSLLALVAEGTYSPDDLAVYLVTKDEKASEFQRQQVNENGQIEGGFASFIEGELEDMKAFLGV